jgi:hypothetical protein
MAGKAQTGAGFAEIVRSPWRASFLRWANNATETVRVAAPFIKLDAACFLANAATRGVNISVLTKFSLHSFERGVSDLNALFMLREKGARLRTAPRLHAKVYLFDESRAVVTSGNLTTRGLSGNIEYGVTITEPGTVREIARDFDRWFGPKGESSPVSEEMLLESRRILANLPRPDHSAERKLAAQQKRVLALSPEEADEEFRGGAEVIRRGLTGWKQHVFGLLNENVKGNRFTLDDAYALTPALSKQYPNNRHVQEKIRQTLQYLRDLGLLDFAEKGLYRKLW